MNPLKNPDAEKCAQEIAAVIHDKIIRQAIFSAYLAAHPALKNWEGQAIGQRAVYIARMASEAKAVAIEAHMATKYPNVI